MRKRSIWLVVAALFALDIVQTSEAQDSCKDKVNWCETYKKHCENVKLKELCKKTCNECGDGCVAAELGCQFSCAVVRSKPVCTCPKGLVLNDDGKNCSDVDECLNPNACPDPKFPVCINAPGKYYCKEVPICQLRPQSNVYYNRTDCCSISSGSCGQNLATRSWTGGDRNAILSQWPWAKSWEYADAEDIYTCFVVPDKAYDRATCLVAVRDDHRAGVPEWTPAGVGVPEWTPAGVWILGWSRSRSQYFRFEPEQEPKSTLRDRPRLNRATVSVALRSSGPDGENSHTQKIGISQVVVHPSYEYPLNDIALIKLQRAVQKSHFVHPICLPNGEKPVKGTSCFLSGYESELSQHGIKRTLKEAGLFVSTQQLCQENLGSPAARFNKHHICAKHDNLQHGCPGETGGPLVCQRCNSCSWYVAGISTFGGICPNQQPYGMFTSVESFEDWISNTTGLLLSNNGTCNNGRNSWRPWSAWSACSRSCEGGRRRRQRSCSGASCSGTAWQDEACNTQHCPRWGAYSSWSSCSETCGTGLRTRTRPCLDGVVGDNGCDDGSTIESQVCNTNRCGWSEWADVTACSATCGTAERRQSRTCLDGEGNCSGSSSRLETCALPACPTWSSWSAWSRCSLSCGGGNRTSSRRCRHGSACPGFSMKTEQCNEQVCQEFPCRNKTDGIGSGFCSENPDWCVRYRNFMSRHCAESCCRTGPIDGLSDWSSWSACSVSCNGGKQYRDRHCNRPGGCGVFVSIPLRQERKCNVKTCVQLVRSVTLWSTCSVTCGGGVQQRTLSLCHKNGSNCQRNEETQSCSTQPCLATWSAWQPWSECSATCGNSSRSRQRTCEGTGRSNQCAGPQAEKEICNVTECYGTWSRWSPYGDCDVTCGTGVSVKRRICLNATCLGESRMEKNCSAPPCPIDPCASYTDGRGETYCREKKKECLTRKAFMDANCRLTCCRANACSDDSSWGTFCSVLRGRCGTDQTIRAKCKRTCGLC